MTIPYLIEHPMILIIMLITMIMGVGRLTRVVTYDLYPPTIWLRSWWIRRVTKGNGWGKLAECFWCASPWFMAVAIGWFFCTPLADWALWTWWIFWGWLALSYAAAIVLARDEPAHD